MRYAIGLLLAAMLTNGPARAQRGRGNQGGSFHRVYTIYLQGNVVLEDGSPPPTPVAIIRACRGQEFPEGFSDPNKGTFSVRVGDEASVAALEDASTYGTDARGLPSGDPQRVGGISGDTEQFSEMGNLGTVGMIGCELRVKLDGYRANPIMLGKRSILDDPDVGTFMLRRLEGVEGVTVSATKAQAPKGAKKAFEKARKEWTKKKPNFGKAAKELEKAVAEFPRFAAAWSLLGRTKVALKDEPGALSAYQMAVKADSKFLSPYPDLIKLCVRAARWDEAVRHCETLLSLNPNAAEERFYLALAEMNLGRDEKAAAALDAILESPVDARRFPQARHLKGVILSKAGDFEGAANEWRQFLAAAPSSPVAADVKRQLHEWEALTLIEPAN